MSIVIHRIPQKVQGRYGRTEPNPEWLALRCGRLCSSEVAAVLDDDGNLRKPRAKADQAAGKYAASVYTLVARVAAERITGFAEGDTFTSAAAEYANMHEAMALKALAFRTDLDFESIGGVENGPCFASTDGVVIVGDRVTVVGEIKIVLPKRQMAYIMDENELLEEHGSQVRVELAISESDRGFLFAYSPEMRSITKEITHDAAVDRVVTSLVVLDALVNDAVAKARE